MLPSHVIGRTLAKPLYRRSSSAVINGASPSSFRRHTQIPNFSFAVVPEDHHGCFGCSIFSSTSSRLLHARADLVLSSHGSRLIRPGHSSGFHNVISSNQLMVEHIRNGDLYSAFNVFDRMPIKTVVTWNILLSGYCRIHGRIKETLDVFDRIPRPNTVSYNTMLSFYFRNSDIGAAREFFYRIPMKDAASWNTMISGFSQNGMMKEAREIFFSMPMKNNITWNSMISGYVDDGDLVKAVDLFSKVPGRSVVTWTAMITGFMRFGMVQEAEKLFDEMPVRNVVTWNSMIAGYVDNSKSEEGLKLFTEMRREGLRETHLTLTSVLLGCSTLSALSLGRQVHQLSLKLPIYSETTVGTSLLSMYAKCGVQEDAWKLFIGIRRKDVVAWNAMICGYAHHGEAERSLSLFAEMVSGGTKPDSITLVALLLACNHSGLIDAGIRYFNSMEEFGIRPASCHYACLVDLLGRAGRLDEAMDLIEKMPFEPHSSVFGTLLGACRLHKNLKVAEYAAERLIGIDPSSAVGYVQFSNVCSAMNRWDLVVEIRKRMNENGVVKEPGYCWIEVRGIVHGFRSRDRVHPELEMIHEKLRDLEKKMKTEGYVPNLESALHDVRGTKGEAPPPSL